MKVLLYGKYISDNQVASVRHLLDILEREKWEVFIYTPYLDTIRDKVSTTIQWNEVDGYEELSALDLDFVFTLGGDGTILNAATLIRDTQVPIMGINLGRLGFLASIEEKFVGKAVEMLKRDQYRLQDRSMLFLETNKPIFGDTRFALNDFTILKRDNSSMIIIHTYLDGEFLNSYWADGLIVSTPTGSTGYSLSCGGPIVYPESRNFILTPVAPHNLNIRPLVIPDDSVLSFEVEGRTENFLCTLDSRFEIITQDFKLSVRRSEFGIKMVQLDEMSFSKTMRNKLNWGYDTRKHF